MKTNKKRELTEEEVRESILSQEEIEALLDVVDEDDLKTMEEPDIFEHTRRMNEMLERDKQINKEKFVMDMDYWVSEDYITINGIKAKKTSVVRMREILLSLNPNVVKEVKFIFTNSSTSCNINAVDLFIGISDRFYHIENISAQWATTLESIILKGHIKVCRIIEYIETVKVSGGFRNETHVFGMELDNVKHYIDEKEVEQ